MAGKFNYEERFKYPHLIGEDSEAWTRFVKQFPNRFDTVDYDVHVGQGAKVFTIEDEKSQKYWTQLTKKRIDVVGWKNDFVTIIEVKKTVGLYTLGQILGYRFLYQRENPELKLIKVLIVCVNINQDDIDILDHFGVDFLIV